MEKAQVAAEVLLEGLAGHWQLGHLGNFYHQMLVRTKSSVQCKQGQSLLQSGSQRQSCPDPVLGASTTFQPIWGSATGTGQGQTETRGSPHLQDFPGQRTVLQPEARSHTDLATNLLNLIQVNPLPLGLLLDILGGMEGARTHSSEKLKEGRAVCPALCIHVSVGV